MKHTQEENLEIQGFKDGYFLMKHQEKLMDLFLKTNDHNTAYMKGLRKGTQEYEQEKKVELDKQMELQLRQNKLRKIAEQEKDRDQDEHER